MKKIRACFWILPVFLLLVTACSRTAMAADSYQIRFHETSKAYFVYSKGRVVKSDHVIALKLATTTVNGRTFRGGVYSVAASGRIQTANGIVYLSENCKVDGKTYWAGYYKAEIYGRLASRSSIVEVKNKTFSGKFFNGIYYHDSTGRILSAPAVKKLNLTYHGVTYNGFYYFGGEDLALRRETGLLDVNGRNYFVLASGRCITSQIRNVKGKLYSFDANGVGTLITADMTALKQKLNVVMKKYPGTWSVYVKKLDSKQSLTIRNIPHYAASEIKPFMMAAVYEQIRQKKLTVTEEIHQYLWDMITESDNDASNSLGEILGNGDFLKGTKIVNSYNIANGYTNSELHHTFRPASQSFLSDGKTTRPVW